MLRSVRQLLKYGYEAPPPTLKMLYGGVQVAELRRTENSYTFRYLDAFKKLGLQPLPGLPLDVEYSGGDLPLYFRERLPDTRRQDVKALMQQFRIPDDNNLLLLATLGKHTVTDPFEFQLSAA
ncbi:MAG TPA: HipA N-terminal domain-containing protein [Terriglobales bacterium]|jgi:HipA-like protein